MLSNPAALACAALAMAVGALPGGPAPLRLDALHRRPDRLPGVRAIPVAVAVAAGALAGLLALGPAGAVVGGGVAVAWRRCRVRTRRDRAAHAATAALADALDRITEEVRSGAHPAAALRGATAAAEPTHVQDDLDRRSELAVQRGTRQPTGRRQRLQPCGHLACRVGVHGAGAVGCVTWSTACGASAPVLSVVSVVSARSEVSVGC